MTTSAAPPPGTTADPSEIPDQPRGGGATWYEVLDLTPQASQAEVQRGYERALDLVEGRTIGGYFLLDPVAVESARSDIESAWAVLSDPGKRSAYDARLGAAPTLLPQESSPPRHPRIDHDEPEQPSAPERVPPPSAETPPSHSPDVTASLKPRPSLRFLKPIDDKRPVITFAPPKTDPAMRIGAVPTAQTSALGAVPTAQTSAQPEPPVPALVATATVLPQAVMPPPVTALPSSSTSNLPSLPTPPSSSGLFALEGEVNGQLLKRLREARGLSLEAMVDATKIRKPYLAAIEEQDFENLPARVYLRGFLMTIGRVLKVDKTKLAEGYLAFVARYGK